MKAAPAAVLLLVFSACAPAGRQVLPEGRGNPEALRRAQAYLERHPGWEVDCSNFVRVCWNSEDLDDWLARRPPGENLTKLLHGYFEERGTRRSKTGILPGDVLFFHRTYDFNRDGRIDGKDAFTHTGIAESLSGGVLTYIDASAGRKRLGDAVIQRRRVHLFGGIPDETVARDPVTGRAIRHSETFFAAYGGR